MVINYQNQDKFLLCSFTNGSFECCTGRKMTLFFKRKLSIDFFFFFFLHVIWCLKYDAANNHGAWLGSLSAASLELHSLSAASLDLHTLYSVVPRSSRKISQKSNQNNFFLFQVLLRKYNNQLDPTKEELNEILEKYPIPPFLPLNNNNDSTAPPITLFSAISIINRLVFLKVNFLICINLSFLFLEAEKQIQWSALGFWFPKIKRYFETF